MNQVFFYIPFLSPYLCKVGNITYADWGKEDTAEEEKVWDNTWQLFQ